MHALHICMFHLPLDIHQVASILIISPQDDKDLHLHVERVSQLLFGPNNVKAVKEEMTDEDFALYQEVVPTILFSIGFRNEKVGSIHYPCFLLGESGFQIGATNA